MIKTHTSQGPKTLGQQVECNAEKGACPNGEENTHLWFDNKEEAEEYSSLALAEQYDEASPRQLKRLYELKEKSNKLAEIALIEEELQEYIPWDVTPGDNEIILLGDSEGAMENLSLFIDPDRPAKSIAEQLREYDVDEIFEDSTFDYGPSQNNYSRLLELRNMQQDYLDIADRLDGSNSSTTSQDYAEPSFGEFPKDDLEVTEEALEEFLEEADLIHANAEVVFEDSGRKSLAVEGPNNATRWIELEEAKNMGEAYEIIERELQEFSAEETFDEIWTPDFGEHSNVTPTQFAEMLEEDEEWFRQVAEELEKTRNKPSF